MSIEEEQSREASGDEGAEAQGDDPSEEDSEESSGSDRHSDLESDMESEEESGQPVGEDGQTRRAPGERPQSDGPRAREDARAELPYTFAGRQTAGSPSVWG